MRSPVITSTPPSTLALNSCASGASSGRWMSLMCAARAGIVHGLEAVHDRTTLDGGLSAILRDAFVGQDTADWHRQVEANDVASPPRAAHCARIPCRSCSGDRLAVDG